MVYLASLGKYSFDAASLDVNKLNAERLLIMAESYPQKTRKALIRNEYIRKT